MSDVKVQQKQSLSRQEAARVLAALAQGLGDDGKVTVELGGSTLELSVGDQVGYELEVEVDGDQIELELELVWSTSAQAPASPADDGSQKEEGGAEEDRSKDVPSGKGVSAGKARKPR